MAVNPCRTLPRTMWLSDSEESRASVSSLQGLYDGLGSRCAEALSPSSQSTHRHSDSPSRYKMANSLSSSSSRYSCSSSRYSWSEDSRKNSSSGEDREKILLLGDESRASKNYITNGDRANACVDVDRAIVTILTACVDVDVCVDCDREVGLAVASVDEELELGGRFSVVANHNVSMEDSDGDSVDMAVFPRCGSASSAGLIVLIAMYVVWWLVAGMWLAGILLREQPQ